MAIHAVAVDKFGGSEGLRDEGALASALARPFQSFGGSYLYPSIEEKAAAIGESIIANHPFTDGNKRTGYYFMEAMLRYGGLKIAVADDTLYAFIIDITTGACRHEQIVAWLRQHTAAL